jgi:dipeptide/tripeptide permease
MLTFPVALYGPVVSPVIMDQYTEQHDYVKRLSNGQHVIVSRTQTLSRIQWLFYGLGNVGPFLAIGTTWAEKRIGFWLSFTVPCAITFFLPFILLVIYRRAIKVKPDGRQLSQALWIFSIVLKLEKWRFFFRADAWDVAKPAVLLPRDSTILEKKQIAWNDDYVDQVKQNYAACKMFFFFVIYNLAGGGIGVIESSQASSLSTNGVPNDLLWNLNPIATVVFTPILIYGLFPFLRRHGIRCGHVSRMTVGFLLASVSSFYGAFLQWRIYRTSPCGYHATGCGTGSGVSHISVWVQSPIYIINALSQLLAWTAAYEIAYLQSPNHMKSVTLSVLLFVGIFDNAISAACAAAITDPYLIWVWAVPGLANLIQTAYFYWNYRNIDAQHSET